MVVVVEVEKEEVDDLGAWETVGLDFGLRRRKRRLVVEWKEEGGMVMAVEKWDCILGI